MLWPMQSPTRAIESFLFIYYYYYYFSLRGVSRNVKRLQIFNVVTLECIDRTAPYLTWLTTLYYFVRSPFSCALLGLVRAFVDLPMRIRLYDYTCVGV